MFTVQFNWCDVKIRVGMRKRTLILYWHKFPLICIQEGTFSTVQFVKVDHKIVSIIKNL